MIYDFTKAFDRERARTRLESLIKREKIVDMTEKQPKRTDNQNRYLHLILTWFGIENGYELEYVKLHYFKVLCNKALFVKTVDDKYLGKVDIVRSSAELDSAEMTTAIERFRNWSAQGGTYLPEPNEEEFLRHIAIEAEKYKHFI